MILFTLTYCGLLIAEAKFHALKNFFNLEVQHIRVIPTVGLSRKTFYF